MRTIKELAPDIIGTQELQSYQVTDIIEATGYGRIGCTLQGNYSLSNGDENTQWRTGNFESDHLPVLTTLEF